MSDLIERQTAISAIQKAYGDTEGGEDKKAVWRNVGLTNAIHIMQDLPSAHSDFFTWLLDEIWYEDVWELNWQAFPELLCRKLEKLGYVKRKGDEYERLDQQTGCD